MKRRVGMGRRIARCFAVINNAKRRRGKPQPVDAALQQMRPHLLDGPKLNLHRSVVWPSYLLPRLAFEAIKYLPDRGQVTSTLLNEVSILVVFVGCRRRLRDQILDDAVQLGALTSVLVLDDLVELLDQLHRQVSPDLAIGARSTLALVSFLVRRRTARHPMNPYRRGLSTCNKIPFPMPTRKDASSGALTPDLR